LNYKNVKIDIAGFLVSKNTQMLTETTGSSNFLFQICQPGVKTRKTSL